MIWAIRLVVASTSRSWISMSLGAPRVPAEPWWIMILALGSASRLPGAPPHRIIAAADMPIPTQIVDTSGADVLHDVVDRHAGVRQAAGGVDVEMDVLVRVLRFEVEDLGHDQVGDLVVDLLAEEHDALLEQQRVDVEGAVAAAGLVDDGRDEGLVEVHVGLLDGCLPRG